MTSRYQYGGDVSDFTYAPQVAGSRIYVTLLANAVTTFWSAQTGGTQYTDLLDANSNPVTNISTDANGNLPIFQGPAGVTAMWADAGGGRRIIHITGTGSSLDADTAANIGNPSTLTSAQLSATYGAVVNHGSTAGTARPTTSLPVQWFGTVNPTNAVNGDTYTHTGTADEKILVAGTWTLVGAASFELQANLDSDVGAKVGSATTATGAAVIKRASATFSPLNLPNLVGWWAADQIGGNVGDSVTTWADLSGNGLDMVAPLLNTPAAQSPAFTSPKIALDPYTSKRVVRFNGTSDVLQAWFQPLMSSATPLQVINGPISLFMAASARPWWTAGGTAQSGRTCCVATLSTTGFIWVQQDTSSGRYQWATRYLNPSNTGRDMGVGTPPSEGLLQTVTAIWDGWQGSFPSVPSSGTWQQNNTGATYNVYISGGTYTDVSVQSALNGAQVGDVTSLGVATMVTVPPGCSIKITYSVAPTWTWVAVGGSFGAKLRVDGMEVFDSFSRQIAPNALTIGAQPPTHGADSNNYNGYAACDIGEIILLNKHATPAEISAVENYLGRAA